MTVAPLFGGTAGRVALDEEYLGQRRVFLRTVSQFTRQPASGHDSLALHHFSGFLGRRTGLGSKKHFLHYYLRFVRMLFQIIGQHITDYLIHRSEYFLVS